MIGAIGLKFINSPWGRYLILALSALAALGGYGRIKRREGERRAKDAIVQNARLKAAKGKGAFYANQTEVDQLAARSISKRLRERSNGWGRM